MLRHVLRTYQFDTFKNIKYELLLNRIKIGIIFLKTALIMHSVYLLVIHLQKGRILHVNHKYLKSTFNYYT